MKTETLEKAYRATTYRVYLPVGVIDLRLGQASAELAAWLADEEVDCWALLSAHNPGGRQVDSAQNAERQSQLECLLLEAEYEPFAGENIADAGDWPVEESCFVPLLENDEAMALASQFGQNAIITGGTDALPRLIWLAEDDGRAGTE